ncbi:hypothetical protein [Novosphingobium sp. KN65.2]|uniref:hypothetical protein n=1 Tax=Novosphingobium sp. KN65.2 TaxID=1478134 RepID=UPI0005E0BE2C|nr:hypothetical protein [Novosphingobium sp. KN65.2]CDO37619.1 exported hypothetical protein [Novosphingobium sp. KN65.2]
MHRVLIAGSTLLGLAFLIGLDRFAAWLMETDSALRDLVLSPAFTVLALAGGIMVASIAVVAFAAFICSVGGPAGRGEPGGQ